ncbi:hypothetical protein GCM10023322_16210 [Rugosimonospora acidiphila]|uniref:Pyrrolo-quinoline quinone repeat domain-containing protein n=1 Tax=Rugosimonospora acidiphila TaxID=556531 RepID=A0ABP9RPQ6_9ACTN
MLVLLLSVSAAPPRSAFVRVATISVQGQVTVEPGPRSVFVGEQTLGGQDVSRYSIATGRRLWRTPVSDTPENLRYIGAAGVVAVSTFEPVPDSARLTVLDVNTGRRLWSTAGYPLWSWPPDAQAQRGQYALLLLGAPAGPRQLRFVQMRTGHVSWSRPIEAGSQVQLADWRRSDAPDILVVGPDGVATVLARATGAVLGRTRLAGMSGPDGANDPTGQTSVSVVGTSVIVQRRAGSVTALTDYTLPGLTRRWQRSGPYFGFPGDCGPVLCVAELDRLVGLDPGSGSIRWSVSDWQGASLIEGDELLGYRIAAGERSGVLDARTGRLLLGLGGWSPLAAFGTARLMAEPDSSDYRYTWFARLDPGGAVLHPMARVTGIGLQGCQPDRDLLFCASMESDVSVWRYAA